MFRFHSVSNIVAGASEWRYGEQYRFRFHSVSSLVAGASE